MTRNVVVSMACGETSRRYSEITFPLMWAYAQSCDADFHALHYLDKHYGDDYDVGFQKWRYAELLGMYDRILHFDADMVVKRGTPNLFQIVPTECFAGVDEGPFQDPEAELPFVDRYSDLRFLGVDEPRFYINVGMYLFGKHHLRVFDPVNQEICGANASKERWVCFKEQSVMNARLHDGYSVHLLPPAFNTMQLMVVGGLRKADAHIVHYAGGWGGKSEDEILELMRADACA